MNERIIADAANRIEQAATRLACIFEDGYGGNALKLIDLIENQLADASIQDELKRQLAESEKKSIYHKSMWDGQINRTKLAEEKLAELISELEKLIKFSEMAKDKWYVGAKNTFYDSHDIAEGIDNSIKSCRDKIKEIK